ncbi:PTS glucose transporter subunit IIA [Vagococcus fluvialis]|uniref:PTS glucose transporter subunit IIA n=1 Tax=Vagococcus fluvialis TaxID=2738 RepID=UPI003D0A071F
MGFFKRKKVLNSIATGNLIPLNKVADEVFSSKMLGNGFAISEHNGEVYSPLDGTIISIFPTKHAITLTDLKGESVLIHMGIDTVDLKGEGFDIFVTENQKVKKGDKLAKMDISFLKEKGKDSTIIIVTPESQAGELLLDEQIVTPKNQVFKL